MRVLFVSHGYPPHSAGGVEQYTAGLAAALVQSGDHVSVVARRSTFQAVRDTFTRDTQPDGVVVYWLAGIRHDPAHFLEEHQRIEDLFTTSLVDTAPDVVHINHLMGLSPRLISIALQQHVPVVLSLLDMNFACALAHLRKVSGSLCAGPDGGRECARTCFAHEGDAALLRWSVRTMYYRRVLRLATRIVCPSQYIADYFAGFGLEPERLHVLPLGVVRSSAEVRTIEESGADVEESGPFRVALLGALVPHKGADLLLAALRLARLPQVEVSALGSAPDPGYLKQVREQAAGIPGLKLSISGQSDPGSFNSLPNGVHCAVVPSVVPESYSFAAREALVLGIPVLASRLGALPEVIRDGDNGFTFDPGRPAELGALLQRLCSDRQLLRRLRAGALRTAVPGVAEHTTRMRDVYLQAIADCARERPASWGDENELATLHTISLQLGFA